MTSPFPTDQFDSSDADQRAWSADDHAIAGELDALGVAERALPDAGFEARLLNRVTRPESFTLAAAPRSPGASRGLRLAAAVALLAGVGSAWLAMRSPAPRHAPTLAGGLDSSRVAHDVDILLSWDAEALDTIDSLYAETLRVDDLIETAWAPLGDDPASGSDGGAM